LFFSLYLSLVYHSIKFIKILFSKILYNKKAPQQMPKGWEWSDGNPIFLAKEFRKMIDTGEVKNQAGLDRLVLLLFFAALRVGNTR